MPSNKIILSPDGRVINNDKEQSASDVSLSYLNKQKDFFSSRPGFFVKSPASVTLPSGLKGLATSDSAAANAVLNEYGIIEEGSDFLKSDSFGFEGSAKDESIKYYTNFNTYYTDTFNQNVGATNVNERVFAEELEMVAGLDFNSLGILTLRGNSVEIEFTKFIFFMDYIIETATYLAAAIFLHDSSISTIREYFRNVLMFRKEDFTDAKSFGDIFKASTVLFIHGLNEYINTDPRNDSLIKKRIITSDNNNPVSAGLDHLTDSFMSLSKIGENRLYLLIRKFQQESYWDSEILYRAKPANLIGAENYVDRFFAQFSQYYFKFIIERINIGRIIATRYHSYGVIYYNGFFLNQRTKIINIKGLGVNTQESRNILSKYRNDRVSSFQYIKNKKIKQSVSGEDLYSIPSLLKLDAGYTDKSFLGTRAITDLEESNFVTNKKLNKKRLSAELVEKYEKELDSAYMPFYLHDLRTNEILAFHAFIDNITDNFNPEYTSSSGYGRIDDVKHYVKTTRNITTTFSIIAQNSTDHDLMWYQINKLVSMVYPQWSDGFPAEKNNKINKKSNNNFKFPFTQVPTASPFVRLRIGNVITSNYSIANLARLHGLKKFSKKIEKSLEVRVKSKNNFDIKTIIELEEPKAVIGDHDEFFDMLSINRPSGIFKFTKDIIEKEQKIWENSPLIDDLKFGEFLIPKRISGQHTVNNVAWAGETEGKFKNYLINLNSTKAKKYNKDTRDARFQLFFDNEHFYVIDEHIFKYEAFQMTGSKNTKQKSVDKKEFSNNKVIMEESPFVKSFDTAKGKGLAGFITMLDVNYSDVVWDTDKKAPHSVKVTINFSPVHDIAPGIDHQGDLRAPTYNVGSINNKVFGDVYDKIKSTTSISSKDTNRGNIRTETSSETITTETYE